MSYFTTAFFLLGALTVLAQGSTLLELLTVFKHGDQCSKQSEELRENFTLSIFNAGPLVTKIMRESSNFERKAEEANLGFCSAPELLLCDKGTEKCVCGDVGKKEDFVTEVDEEGATRCRWAQGTYCVSEDILRTQGGRSGMAFNSKCAQGLKCTSKSDGESECSYLILLRHVLSSYSRGLFGRRPSLRSIMKDIYTGKICTCQPDPATNAISDEEYWDWENVGPSTVGRVKRSVAADQFQFKDEKTASLGPAMALVDEMFA